MIVRVQHSRASAGGATQRRFAQHRVLQRLKRIEWGAMHVRVCIVCGLLGGEGNKSRHAAVRPPPTRRGALRVPPPKAQPAQAAYYMLKGTVRPRRERAMCGWVRPKCARGAPLAPIGCAQGAPLTTPRQGPGAPAVPRGWAACGQFSVCDNAAVCACARKEPHVQRCKACVRGRQPPHP